MKVFLHINPYALHTDTVDISKDTNIIYNCVVSILDCYIVHQYVRFAPCHYVLANVEYWTSDKDIMKHVADIKGETDT